MVMSLLNNSVASGTNVVQQSWGNRKSQYWNVRPVDSRIGGDFSYYTICASQNDFPIDVWNWSLDNGGDVRLYNGGLGTNEQWYLQYAGEGYYYIRSRHSNLCLEVAGGSKTAGGNIQQGTYAGDARQQWKIIPVTSRCKLTPPESPVGLTAETQRASVLLRWRANGETDIAGYMVLRADAEDGEWNTIARTVPDTLFIDNSVLPAHTYIYKVKAIDESDNISDCSDEVTTSASDGTMGCIAHYEFDETLRDTTENHFNLALYGNELFTKTERYVVSGSHSLRLDGTNFLQAPPTLLSSDEVTICLWMYWTGGSAGAGQRIFDFGIPALGGGQEVSLYLTPSDGSHMRFAICKDGEEQTLLASKFPALKMKHVALTIASDSVTLYIDGERVAATADITLRPSALRPILGYVGRPVENRKAASVPLLKAYLDDLRIYNYALTAAEIQQVMTDIDTGIQSPMIEDAESGTNTSFFNLKGQTAAQPERGIYIQNGKKIWIK